MFSLKHTFKKTLRLLFIDGVQLSQGYKSDYEETVNFLPLGPHDVSVLIQSVSEGWKAELTLEPPAVLNLGPLDWESSTLTTRPLLVQTFPSPFYMWANIVQVQLNMVRATDSFSAQSIFHSPSYTKCDSSFRTIKQNKSLLLVKNDCGCLILLAQKRSSQVAWFHSTSIFQWLYFYFLLECLAIYF